MSKTKDKILKCALRLFNERGVNQVSLRTISSAMNISLGNLTYHFKRREEIIEALYFDLVGQLDTVMGGDLVKYDSLKLLFEIPNVIISCFYEYRFLLLDFVYLTRSHPAIGKHYQELLKLREQQFELLLEKLIKAKLLREELVPNEYKYLFKNLRIVSDFWISALYIDNKHSIRKKDISEGAQLLKQLIFPYLTAKGRRALK